MRHAYEKSELLKLTRRYVTPGQRYLKLGGSLLGMSGRERAKFTRKLGKAASDIRPRELGILLNGGWRERTTAAWLIAVADRTEFRERLGELQLPSARSCCSTPDSAPARRPGSSRQTTSGSSGSAGRRPRTTTPRQLPRVHRPTMRSR
jgi:hypothetical protein